MKLSKEQRRARDSHLRCDPHVVWQRVMGVKIDRRVWAEIQRTHFTYWYMQEV